MNQRVVKSAVAALFASGALAGCATSVDWGGPLLHYRYNYDSRPVTVQEPVVVPAPTSSYSAPPVVSPAPTSSYGAPPVVAPAPTSSYGAPPLVYRESTTVTQYPDSRTTYRTYGEPVVTYRQPTVIYSYPIQPSPFTDKGE